MSDLHTVCRRCGAESSIPATSLINVSVNPDLKERLLSGELFIWECPECGERNLAVFPLLYHDPTEKIMLWLSDSQASTEEQMKRAIAVEGMEGYTGRIVDTPGALIEKVKIFDAGLDDIAVELCKYVTRQEMGKDVDLLFFGIDGADNEITLTYPENGEMQMLRIGFNVYEDCAAIVRRNPDMKKAATGLCRVGRSFVEGFLG